MTYSIINISESIKKLDFKLYEEPIKRKLADCDRKERKRDRNERTNGENVKEITKSPVCNS